MVALHGRSDGGGLGEVGSVIIGLVAESDPYAVDGVASGTRLGPVGVEGGALLVEFLDVLSQSHYSSNMLVSFLNV